jgi:hypothetical protein
MVSASPEMGEASRLEDRADGWSGTPISDHAGQKSNAMESTGFESGAAKAAESSSADVFRDGGEMKEGAATGTSRRVPELDGLRGLAIVLVLLCHYIGNSDHEALGGWADRVLWLFRGGWVGVDLFFVLSGFLIGGILLDAREAPHYFKAFYLRRAHRILPVYFSLLALFAVSVCVLQLFPQGRAQANLHELSVLPRYVFFLQNFFAIGSDFH